MPRKYELSFAGVTLPLASPELEDRLARIHPQNDFNNWSAWNFEGWDLTQLPTPPLPDEPEFRFGVLHWPTGASRPAWFHAVVNTPKLEEIRTAVGDPMTPKPLLMRAYQPPNAAEPAGLSTERTASLYMLPPRPLVQMGEKDLWVLTLTDQRFYFMWRRGDIATQPASWEDLFASLGTILGVSIDVDTINPGYTPPSTKWIGYQRPTAAVLDAAATQIGHRVVFGLDGSVRTVNWQTAKSECDAYLNNVDPKLLAGGLLDAQDLGRYVPRSVRTLFATLDSAGQPTAEPTIVENFLGSLSPLLAGHASSLFGTASGFPGATGIIMGDLAYDGTAASGNINPYASGAAFDWYGWRGSNIDVVFPGIEEWEPTGWEDFSEWIWQRREDTPYASTRVRRGPWDDFASGNWFAGLDPDDTDSGGGVLSCNPHGWLDDEEALEDAASPVTGNDPPRVLRYWVMAGVAGGRCECILEQWTVTSEFFPGIAQAHFSSDHQWVGNRMIHTCLGCGLPTFTIPGNTSNAFPKITGVLTLTGGGTYNLKYHCAGRNPHQVIMALSGTTVCNSTPSPEACENVAYVVVECDDCELENVACDQCREVCDSSFTGPGVIRIVATGFTGDKAGYNGVWPLEFVGDCEWELICGGITVNLTMTPTGPNDTTVVTVTFSGSSGSGGAGGPVTYLYTSPEIITGVGTNVSCFESRALTRDDSGGVVPDAPDTITTVPIYCRPCPDLCASIDFENMTADVISSTGDCDCVILTFASFVAGESATFGLTGCANNVQVHVRCSGGRLRVDISGSATQSFAEVSLVVTDTVFEWTVDIGFVGDPNDPCAGTFRVVFAAPII